MKCEYQEVFIWLENVPDEMQASVNEKGGTVVIAETIQLSSDDLEEIGQEIGVRDRETAPALAKWLVDGGGIYKRGKKEAVVDQHQTSALGTNIEYTSLHEYGHMLDYLSGNPSLLREFVEIYDRETYRNWGRDESRVPVSGKESGLRQIFADRFARFYLSTVSRKKLKIELPETYDYFIGLEKRFVHLK